MTGSVDAARDVIIDGIQHVPHCKLLLEVSLSLLHVPHGIGPRSDNVHAIRINQ